jgi:hypothetical protein
VTPTVQERAQRSGDIPERSGGLVGPLPNRQSVPVLCVRLIGYWAPTPRDAAFAAQARLEVARHRDRQDVLETARPPEPDWPNPQNFVDPTWDVVERSLVAQHLEGGDLYTRYRGLSRCRFCEKHNGSAEYTDGVYVWPEGLAHYVLAHDVRLPGEFVSHVVSSRVAPDGSPSAQYDDLGQRVPVVRGDGKARA